MLTEQTRRNLHEAHSDYLKMRAEYRAALADMEIEIKPEDYADQATGLLNGPKLRNGLTVHIPAWPNLPPPGETDVLVLYLDNGNGNLEEVMRHEFTVPAAGGPFPETFPYAMTIDVNELPDDATCRLQYIITDYTGFETPSFEKMVICDRLPPYKNDPPAAPVFAGDTLDDSSLPVGGQLMLTVPGYADWKSSDVLEIYMVNADDIPEDPTNTPPIYVGFAPSPGISDSTVLIDAEKIRAFGDANGVFTYALHDKALNNSPAAYFKLVTLTFGPLPANLTPPEVPQAIPGPLSMEHVSRGVSVWIDTYDNPKSGDIVRAKWGGTALSDYFVGDRPPSRLEISVLPALLMLRDYGEFTTGIKPTDVSYEVIRKGRVFGPESATFDVNFETPVPWLPWPPVDWPDPVHPQLQEGTVKNYDDSRTNQLTRADKGQDATFTFTWHDTAKNGDVIDFFWNGIPVVEAQITFDDSTDVPGDDRTVDILWKYIKDGGNGDPVPVHYKFHRPGVENDLNSLPTPVEVNAIAIELPAASFPKIPNPTGYPGCGSLETDGSLLVKIPDLTGILKAGDTIQFEFIPMIGSDLTAPDDPIPGVKFEKDFKLGDPGIPLSGFTFAVEPYATYIKPLYDENPDRRGRAKISFKFYDGTEDVGSTPLVTRTAFHRPSDECPIP